MSENTENTENVGKASDIIETNEKVSTVETIMKTPNYATLYKTRGRPKMKPEDKKPRKRKSKVEAVEGEQVDVVANDDLEEKIHKLEVLKGQWNEYYRKNRERILYRKKELREAKERMLNESMGVVKVERRGRKRSGGVMNREVDMEHEMDRVCGLKCLE
jgi:hypothetical protein